MSRRTLHTEYQRTVEELGRLLKAARQEAQFDQRSVELEVGISQGWISKIERGVGVLPKLDTVVLIAGAVGADVPQVRLLVLRAQLLRHFANADTTIDELSRALELEPS